MSTKVDNHISGALVQCQLKLTLVVKGLMLPPDLPISSPTTYSGIKALQLQLSMLVTNPIGELHDDVTRERPRPLVVSRMVPLH